MVAFSVGPWYLDIQVGELAEWEFESTGPPFRFDVVESPVYGPRQIGPTHGQIALSARAISGND